MSRPMEEWPGLLRADWRVMSKDSISFWLAAILCYNKLLKLFERHPIVDFASVVERQNAAMYLFGQFSSYISHNYTPHSSFQFYPIPTFPPSSLFVHSFIHTVGLNIVFKRNVGQNLHINKWTIFMALAENELSLFERSAAATVGVLI